MNEPLNDAAHKEHLRDEHRSALELGEVYLKIGETWKQAHARVHALSGANHSHNRDENFELIPW